MSTPGNSTLPSTLAANPSSPVGGTMSDRTLPPIGATGSQSTAGLNSKERKAAAQVKRPPGIPGQVDTRRTMMPHDKKVALIKKELAAKGVLPVQKTPVDEHPQPTGVVGSMVAVAQLVAERVNDAVNGLMPGLPGASAADTCEVDRSCDESIFSKVGQLATKMDHAVVESPSVKQQTTGKGVVILIADFNHDDRAHHREMEELVKALIHPFSTTKGDDKLLVESTGDDLKQFALACKDQAPHVTCIPIDDPVRASKLDESKRIIDAAAKALLIAMNKRGVKEAAGTFSSWEMVTRAEELLKRADAKMKAALKQEIAAFESTARDMRVAIAQAAPARDAYFLEQIKRYAGPTRTIFVILGAEHVAQLKAAVFTAFDALLIYSKAGVSKSGFDEHRLQ